MLCCLPSISHRYLVWVAVLACAWLMNGAHAESPQVTLDKLRMHQNVIASAAKKFGVPARYLMAIIYTERTLNYDWTDDELDIPLAKALLNSSIGFCQVKLKTAYFIERQFHDDESLYYPGERYQDLLQVSQSPDQLIAKLADDTLNIDYAAGYIRIILSRWEKAGFPLTERLDILGTLYSSGLYYKSGQERKPNRSPQANEFGKKALNALKILTAEGL